MSVSIVAKFPWRGIRLLAESEPPSVQILTDTRISVEGGKILELKAPKQYRLSKNLIVCFTSSNLFPTIKALDLKEKDPTCGDGAYSSIDDIKQLGRIVNDMHYKYGGLSEVIAVIWEKGHEQPKIYELMPPSYIPTPREGIIGIGQRDVLNRFKELYNLKPFGIFGTKGTGDIKSSLILASAFSQAIEEIKNYSVDLPIQLTIVTKEGIHARKLGIYRKDSTEAEPLTANDNDLTLLEGEIRIKRYKGPKRKAIQLLPGLPKKSNKQYTKLRVVLKKENKYALNFVAILDGYTPYAGNPYLFGDYAGFWIEYHENGTTFSNTPKKENNAKYKVPLRKLIGHKKITASGYNFQNIRWNYQPEPDSVTEKTLIVDIDNIPQPSKPFTTELWVVEKDRIDLLEKIINGTEYKRMPIIDYILADWTNPILVIVLWTLSPKAWSALEQSLINT